METISNLVMSAGSVSFVNGTLVVTSGITTNANSANATISGLSLSLNNSTVPFSVADGAAAVDLDVSAGVQNGSVTKNGLGTMRFSGNLFNLYSGTTTVNAGTLILTKSGIALGISGPLVIGDGAGGANSDVVRLDASNQISTSVAPLITESGLLALNNVNQMLSGITLTGGNVTTGTGTLTLTGPVTSNASAQTAAISGKLSSSVDVVFSVANGAAATDLDVSAAISTSGVAG